MNQWRKETLTLVKYEWRQRNTKIINLHIFRGEIFSSIANAISSISNHTKKNNSVVMHVHGKYCRFNDERKRTKNVLLTFSLNYDGKRL